MLTGRIKTGDRELGPNANKGRMGWLPLQQQANGQQGKASTQWQTERQQQQQSAVKEIRNIQGILFFNVHSYI